MPPDPCGNVTLCNTLLLKSRLIVSFSWVIQLITRTIYLNQTCYCFRLLRLQINSVRLLCSLATMKGAIRFLDY